jgi:hypothetical protein
MLWLAIGAYAVQLKYFDTMFEDAHANGSTMTDTGIFLTKAFCLLGNHGAALAYGLNRFQVISFSQFVVLDGVSQFIAKFFFGMAILMSLGERKIKH